MSSLKKDVFSCENLKAVLEPTTVEKELCKFLFVEFN